jgi:hypothetical protein
MKSISLKLLLVCACLFVLSSCSGVKNACTSCTPTGNGTLSLTLSDTPPIGVSVVSFTLPISGISLTPSTGSPVSVYAGGSFELTHLATDSTPVAVGVAVPAGSYTSINVTLGTSSGIFFNGSGSAITVGGNVCVTGAFCNLPNGAATTISVPITLSITENQAQWIGLDMNLSNAITPSNGITVDFTQTGVLAALTTPRTNIPSGDVDSIDDFTGLVTAYTSGSSITIKSGTRGSMVATITSSTTYDDPQNLCASASSIASCISAIAPTVVSVQAYLTNTGAINVSEIDIIDTSGSDSVEGFIYPTSILSCSGGFGLLLFDSTVISGNATLTGLTYGAGFCLTVSTTAPFVVDGGLLTSAGLTGSQAGFQSPTDITAGQVVRVQVSRVTPGALVGATVNEVLLRYSRFPATVNVVSGNNFSLNVTSVPSYLPFTLSPLVATYPNNTIFEGVANVSSLANSQRVGVRALYFANAGVSPVTSANFIAAKVRAN